MHGNVLFAAFETMYQGIENNYKYLVSNRCCISPCNFPCGCGITCTCGKSADKVVEIVVLEIIIHE